MKKSKKKKKGTKNVEMIQQQKKEEKKPEKPYKKAIWTGIGVIASEFLKLGVKKLTSFLF